MLYNDELWNGFPTFIFNFLAFFDFNDSEDTLKIKNSTQIFTWKFSQVAGGMYVGQQKDFRYFILMPFLLLN